MKFLRFLLYFPFIEYHLRQMNKIEGVNTHSTYHYELARYYHKKAYGVDPVDN